MTTITAILTCYNRREKTVNCLKSLVNGNPLINFKFIVVDDNSSDGTIEAVKELGFDTDILKGTGSLFWSGGMRKGIEYYLNNNKTDYVILVNDDVDFFNNAIEKILNHSVDNHNVIVGATCNYTNELTYGGIKLVNSRKGGWYRHVRLDEGAVYCDTFNANCILLKDVVIRTVGNFDPVYRHSLADFDYGLTISNNGFKIVSSKEYVGICNSNSTKGSWRDTSLNRMQRMKQKESIKGAPFKEWYYFLNKNFNFWLAIRYSITPYLRILLRK